MTRAELYRLLTTAIEQPFTRVASVQRFQQAIFDGDAATLGLTEHEWDVFTQLAQDLDYYESNREQRRDSTLFYGSERLLDEIRNALAKVGEHSMKPQGKDSP